MSNAPPNRSSGGAGVVILVAVILLGLPCLVGIVALAGAFFWVGSVKVSPAQPVVLESKLDVDPTTMERTILESPPLRVDPTEVPALPDAAAPTPDS